MPRRTRLQLHPLERREMPSATLVADINVGTGSSNPTNLTHVNGFLYFTADTTGTPGATDLWKSNGTASGTVKITVPTPLTNYAHLTAVDNKLFFTASESTHGNELWVVADGATAQLVQDMNPGPGDSSPIDLTSWNGELYFTTLNSPLNKGEIWISDGTSGNTMPVTSIVAASASAGASNLTPVGNLLYFSADDGTHGKELWKLDTTLVAQMVKDINGNGSSMTDDSETASVGGALVFIADDGTQGKELWRSDGTSGGTYLLRDILGGSGSSNPHFLTAVGSDIFFFANDGLHGTELWESDNAGANPQFFDINTGSGSSNPSGPGVDFKNAYYFADAASNDIWGIINNNAVQTNPAGVLNPSDLTVSGSTLFFVATNAARGRELWQTDGAFADTHLSADINPGTPSSNPTELTDVNGVLLFAATDKAHDTELWRGASSALAPSSLSSVFAVGTGENVVATVATYARDGSLVPGGTLTPFGSTFAGGIRPAIADFNGDGTADIAVASGPGIAAEVIVFDGATGQKLFDTQPFGATFTGGLYISAGDIDNDGKAELVVTPDVSGGPRVTVFKGGTFTVLADFLGIDDSNFRGGCRTAVGDVDGDGFSDIVVAAGFGGGPRVSIFKGGFLLHSQFTHVVPDFFMFENTLRNGIYVAVGDINGDGKAEVIGGGGPGGGPRVLVLDGATLVNQGSVAAIAAPVDNFFAGNVNNRGGIRLTTKDLDLDDRADLVTGDGADSGSHVTVYLGSSLGTGDHTTKYLDYDAYPGLTSGVFVG